MSFKSRFLGGYTPSFLPSWKDPFYKGYDLDGALAKYDFSIPDLDLAILEQVNRQVSMLTLRDANQNVEQLNGTIKTYGQGEAGLVVGSGALIEDAATQLLAAPLDFTDVSWTKVTTTTVSNGYSDPNGGLGAYLVDNLGDASGQRLFSIVESGLSTDGRTFCGSLYFKADGNDGDVVAFQIKRTVGGTFAATTDYVTLTSNWQRVDVVFTGVTGNLGASLSIISDGTSTANRVVIYCANVVESGFVSSPIFVGSGTRDACDCTLDTKLEMGALLETPANSTVPCTLANRDTDGYTNGVNTSTLRVSFANGTPNGKYSTLAATAVGAVLSANNSVIQLSTYAAPGIFTYDLIKGDANDFQYPAQISINWNRSAYTEAQVITLRTTAGDANVWPAAVPWPTTNLEIEIDLEWRGANVDFYKIFQMGNNPVAGQSLIEWDSAASRFNAIVRDPSITAAGPVMATPQYGDVINFRWRVTSTGSQLFVNGVGGTFNAAQTRILVNATTARLFAEANGNRPLNGVLQRFNIRQLT